MSGMDSQLMSMWGPGRDTHCLHEEGHTKAEQDARRVGADGVGECHVCSTLACTRGCQRAWVAMQRCLCTRDP